MIEFRDVSLNLSSFVSGLIGPALGQIQKVIKPIQPLIDLLTTKIPVISDLENRTVTFLDLAAELGGGDAKPFIQAVETLVNAIDLLDDLSTSGDILIHIGTFKIGEDDDHDLRDPSKTLVNAEPSGDGNSFNEGQLNQGINQTGGSSAHNTGSFLSKLKNSGISLPFVTSPSQIFNLISGDLNGINFFEWKMPTLKLDFTMSEFIPIFDGLDGFFGGEISMAINLDFGYDSKGIAQFMRNPVVDNSPVLLNGFFIRDYTDPAQDGNPPEVEFDLKVEVGAAVGIPGFVEAGADGGLEGIVKLDLNSEDTPDGLMRANDFVQIIESRPQCLFDVSGELDVFLDAFIWVGVQLGISKITLFQDSIEFVRLTLVNFNFHCDPVPPPEPAKYDAANDILYLNMGPRRRPRQLHERHRRKLQRRSDRPGRHLHDDPRYRAWIRQGVCRRPEHHHHRRWWNRQGRDCH